MEFKTWKLLGLLFVAVLALSAASIARVAAAASTVTVSGAPWGVAYDAGKGELWVVDSGAGKVLALSDKSYAVLATVGVGQSPYRDVYDAGKGEVFVANYGANTVSVISDANNSVVATVPVGTSPSSFAYDSAKGEVFVANSGGNTVSVIADGNNSVVATVTVGTGPYDLCYDSAMGEVFVANAYSRSVSVISDSNNTVVATVPVGSGPLGVDYDPAKGEVFVANSVSGTVSVISDSSDAVVATVTVGSSPGAAVYDPNKGEVFILNRNAASVSVISDANNSVVATLAVGTKPYGATYDSGRGEVIVANYGSGTLSIISDSPTTVPSSTSELLQQVWVPQPANAAAAVAVSAVAMGVVSAVFAAVSNPLGSVGGTLAEKTKDLIPDNIRDWMSEVLSSKTEETAVEKAGSVFMPTATEILAYVVSIVVLALSFSYVKVATFDQIWGLLPVYLATSVFVGFVQEYVSIVYLRRRGVWSEERIWPLGLILFAVTTFALRTPFSQPARSASTEKNTEQLTANASALGILISLAFAGVFFVLLEAGFAAIGGAGLAMCVITSFIGTFPVSPMSGKDIYDNDRRRWRRLFLLATIVFVAWLLLL